MSDESPAAEKADELDLLPVNGVRLGVVAAGIRYPDRRDLVALMLDPGSTAAAVFTRNAFCAAPVQLARAHLKACDSQPRLLLVNTGNANAGTGASGLAAAQRCCDRAAELAGIRAEEVLPFSTGVIGEDLPDDVIRDALPTLVASAQSDHWADAAWGILTTDTRPKGASRRFEIDGESYTLTGIAKGSGMLRPNMATMLAFLATDAPLTPAQLQTALAEAVEKSFHRITVDGDTSTNDAVVLVSTGTARQGAGDARAFVSQFQTALDSLCLELALGLVRDGEGASRFVEIAVGGGASQEECLAVAFTVAHSPLVKTALFAGDPNWGRILAAIGRADVAKLDVNGVRITINELPIAERGARAAAYDEQAIAEVMAGRELVLHIDLGRGHARERVWTSDFSYDYVRINAEYRS